ncbi:DNA-directed primase/polymerase protein isoform X1 [Lepisosteus oculatus]|uniref:DNA-directed primase/polymerase protein isoform X1 n=2 Tax=Lepisosteus oculatus TaxID=7918 RepID=UPI0035F50C6F
MIRQEWGERVRRVACRAEWYQHWPLSSPYKPRLSRPWQPSTLWRVFPRQGLAFAFAKSRAEGVHVFALENGPTEAGQRIYLVTTYAELWHYYRTYRRSLMHCYEVIPEGAVCKLYFDLEFHRPSNEGRDGKQMVAFFIQVWSQRSSRRRSSTDVLQYVCLKLEEEYGIKISRDDVLNLDSSTEEKFSRHLIFLVPNAAFKDNIHVGHFVHKVLKPALEELRRRRHRLVTETHLESNGQPASSQSPLPSFGPGQEPEAERLRNPYPKRQRTGEGPTSPSPQAGGLLFLFVKDRDGQDQLFVDVGVYTKNRNFRLYKSSKAGKNVAFSVAEDNTFVPRPQKHLSHEEQIFLASLVSNVRFSDGLIILTCDVPEATKTKCIHTAVPKSGSVGGCQYSPYIEVDNFVLSLVNKDGIEGTIRQWNYFSSEELLVYDISKYRWCQNVGRFHKSNNIMILVDLKEEVWYQKCHDPVCRSENYRSPSLPLPREVCLGYLVKEDENDFAFTMDEAGNIVPSQGRHAAEAGGPCASVEPTGRAAGWEPGPDDQACLQALEEVELRAFLPGEPPRPGATLADEIPDELLLDTLIEYESQAR